MSKNTVLCPRVQEKQFAKQLAVASGLVLWPARTVFCRYGRGLCPGLNGRGGVGAGVSMQLFPVNLLSSSVRGCVDVFQIEKNGVGRASLPMMLWYAARKGTHDGGKDIEDTCQLNCIGWFRTAA